MRGLKSVWIAQSPTGRLFAASLHADKQITKVRFIADHLEILGGLSWLVADEAWRRTFEPRGWKLIPLDLSPNVVERHKGAEVVGGP